MPFQYDTNTATRFRRRPSFLLVRRYYFYTQLLILSAIIISRMGVIVEARPTLRQVHVITRHGSRRPLSKTSDTLEEGTTTSEQSLLTPLGQQQHYQLGEWLRERYLNMEDATEFGTNVLQVYNPGQSHFESSSYERTLSSANSLALGLFPLDARGLQLVPAIPANVPVYSQDRRNDVTIRAYDKCPAFHDALEDLYVTQTWQQIQRDAMPLLRKLASILEFQKFAVTVRTDDTQNGLASFIPLQELWNCYDAIAVARQECPPTSNFGQEAEVAATCDPAIVPDPSLATVVTEEEWEKIELLSHAAELLKYGRDVAENKVGGVLWHTILQRMMANNDNNNNNSNAAPFRFYVTSAHYPTILGLFAALGIPFNSNEDKVIPEYASALIIELYHDDDNQQQYIKLLYKSGVQTEAISVLVSSQCRTSLDPGCTIEDFATALEAVQVTPEQWCGLCSNTDVDACMQQELQALQQRCSEDSNAGVIVGSYFAGIITAFFIVCFTIFCKRRCSHQSSVDIEMNHPMDQTMDVKPPCAAESSSTQSIGSAATSKNESEKQVDMAIYT